MAWLWMNKNKEHFVDFSELVTAKTTGRRHVLVYIYLSSILPVDFFIISGTEKKSSMSRTKQPKFIAITKNKQKKTPTNLPKQFHE